MMKRILRSLRTIFIGYFRSSKRLVSQPFTLLTLFFLFFASLSGDGWKPLFTIRAKCDFFTTDNAGNSYMVKGDEIRKYNASGELLKVYSNKKSGRIASLDASNPLRILVFYKDFARIVFLDSQLSENGEGIALETMNLEQCDLACTSFNNGIWLYNRQNAELVRLNENLSRIVSTGNLNRLLNTELHPVYLTENNGYVYMNNPAEGILVFDIYGTYYKTIAIKNIRNFQLKDEELVYFSEKKVRAYNMKTISNVSFSIGDTNVVQMRTEKSYYYLQYPDSLVGGTIASDGRK